MLEEIINRLGKDWTKEARDNFGFEDVKKFIDFYNNGGFEFHGSVNYALT